MVVGSHVERSDQSSFCSTVTLRAARGRDVHHWPRACSESSRTPLLPLPPGRGCLLAGADGTEAAVSTLYAGILIKPHAGSSSHMHQVAPTLALQARMSGSHGHTQTPLSGETFHPVIQSPGHGYGMLHRLKFQSPIVISIPGRRGTAFRFGASPGSDCLRRNVQHKTPPRQFFFLLRCPIYFLR